MNEITIHGHVGKAPSIHHSGTGTAAVRFSVAVNDGYYDRNRQWRSAPSVWHDVVVFGELANNVYDTFMASGGKGLLVTVTGTFSDNSYTRESQHPDGEDIVIRRIQLKARDVAISLQRATAVVTRKKREDEPPVATSEPQAAEAATKESAAAA